MRKLFILILLVNFVCAGVTKETQTKDLNVLSELDINKSFLNDADLKRIFKQYSGKNHLGTYVQNIKNSSEYVATIEDVLEKKNMPSSLIFMPMAESNFKIKTTSSAKAAGIWQFIPQTAKLLNLKNNSYVDERLDFIKSTNAATKYLQGHHDRFGKWYLAILAYNCGEGKLIEAISNATIDKYIQQNPNAAKSDLIVNYKKTLEKYGKTRKDFNKVYKIYKKLPSLNVTLEATDLIKVYSNKEKQYLPSESRKYLKKIIAFAMLANRNFYQKKSLFNKDATITTVKAQGGTTLSSIAQKINVPKRKLEKLNAHLKKGILPKNEKFYALNIPKNKVSLFEEKVLRITRNSNKSSNKDYLVHKVQDGDTLSHIASKYDVDYTQIMKKNDMKTSMLVVDQKLIIPINN